MLNTSLKEAVHRLLARVQTPATRSNEDDDNFIGQRSVRHHRLHRVVMRSHIQRILVRKRHIERCAERGLRSRYAVVSRSRRAARRVRSTAVMRAR